MYFSIKQDHLVESFDEYSRAAILTVGMDNIVGVLPNVASQVENIQQFVRRLDGVMPNVSIAHIHSSIQGGLFDESLTVMTSYSLTYMNKFHCSTKVIS